MPKVSSTPTSCIRLCDYCRRKAWPPTIVVDAEWADLHAAAIEGIDILPDVDAAFAWVIDLIARIAHA